MDNGIKMNTGELPKPMVEKGKVPASTRETASPVSHEQEGLSPLEMLTQAQGAVAQAVQPIDPNPVALPMVPISDPLATDDSSNNPVVAEDNDVLEKEWVDKAKQIVSETKNDPGEQTNRFVKMRYDYVKKRYGKEIVVSSDKQAA